MRSPEHDAVARIYAKRDGSMPDLSRFDRRSPVWKRWAIGGGLVALAVLAFTAWASFFVFKPYTAKSGDVTISIEAPPIANVGEEITYRIRVANDDRVPIARASLDVRLPEHFVLVATDPALDDARAIEWTLGSIAGRSSTTVTVRGRLYGTPTESARIAATVTYRPGNFNADFQTRDDAATVLGASPITLTLTGPERAVPNERVTYTITYVHTGTLATPSVSVALTMPQAFVFNDATPSRATNNDLTWDLAELRPGDGGEIVVHGSFSTGASDPSTIRATATTSPSGERLVLNAQETTTEVLGGNVAIIATVNDQTSGITARPGDVLRFRIAVRNDGRTTIGNATVRAIFEASSVAERSILNFSAMTDPAGGAATGEQLAAGLRRGTITWSPNTAAGLASLPPGEQRTIDVTIPLHDARTLPGFPSSGRIAFTAQVEIGTTGDLAKPYTVATSPMTITVQSR